MISAPGSISRLDRIGLDQRLGEAMDRAADKLVERLSRLLEIGPLFGGNALGKGDLEIRRDFALGEFVDEASDADQQFAGGELGEGDGGDAFGLDAPGEEHGDAASHDRGLAGTGPSFDQQGTLRVRSARRRGPIDREVLWRQPSVRLPDVSGVAELFFGQGHLARQIAGGSGKRERQIVVVIIGVDPRQREPCLDVASRESDRGGQLLERGVDVLQRKQRLLALLRPWIEQRRLDFDLLVEQVS